LTFIQVDEITISVNIADRPYKITIKREDEETIRLAVKDINDKIKSFSQLYDYKDNQDLLSIALIQLSTELFIQNKKTEKETNNIIEKIKEISDTI